MLTKNWANCFLSHHPIPLYQYTKVEITQQLVTGRYMFTVKIGGKLALNVHNTNPRSFNNVKVYEGVRRWHPATARIRNFLYKNLPDDDGK